MKKFRLVWILGSVLSIVLSLKFYNMNRYVKYHNTLNNCLPRIDTEAENDNLPATKPLKQLQFLFDCDSIDSDTISEFLFEMGSLSVSCEVATERETQLDDDTLWADLVKTRNWQSSLLRANFPCTFNLDGLVNILSATFPENSFEYRFVDVEDIDWVLHVQSTWKPIVIGDVTIRFPWHEENLISTQKQILLEGGAAFGTGDHPTTRLCCRWLQSISEGYCSLLGM